MCFTINSTNIPDCIELFNPKSADDRGFFLKVFHINEFHKRSFNFFIKEIYYSYSHHGVIRGLHFQFPPKQLFKLVTCPLGEIYDVVVDLRIGSPTFKEFRTLILNSEKGNSILIPPGCAHGFCVTSEYALVTYQASETYDSQCDTGILWNSIEIPWPKGKHIISQRDQNFVPISEFNSPFFYE
ncbi:MAG: dTDP-4-dehydrorhamnose 3,5-epimerase family protein [Chitinivibrionales bacterium]|nr:dTDP-4-dehydrorhamnose 3,5-epimerase family protein [Chitinivibrionales bacterium]